MHAQQVLAHAEGLAQQVSHDAVARDVRDGLAQPGVRCLGEERDERRVALALVVAHQHDILAGVERLLDRGPALGVTQDRAVELHQRPDVRVGHLVVIERLANADVVRRELVRRPDDLPGVRRHHVLEDARQRLARSRLVPVRRLQHLRLVRVDQTEEGGLVLGREHAGDGLEPALAGKQLDGQLRRANLDVLQRIGRGRGLHRGAHARGDARAARARAAGAERGLGERPERDGGGESGHRGVRSRRVRKCGSRIDEREQLDRGYPQPSVWRRRVARRGFHFSRFQNREPRPKRRSTWFLQTSGSRGRNARLEDGAER